MPKVSHTLVAKAEIAPHVLVLTFATTSNVKSKAGQFCSFEIAHRTMRSYSYMENNQAESYIKTSLPKLPTGQVYASFLISTKSIGLGSDFFREIQIGQSVEGFQCLGKFGLTGSDKVKNFVCTGTGLAPIIPMILYNAKGNPNVPMRLFFGTSFDVGDFVRDYFVCLKDLKLLELYTGFFPVLIPTETKYEKNATVTQILPTVISDYTNEEFYLCGNPFMVADVNQLLKSHGATAIFQENFGTLPAPAPAVL